MVTAHDPAASPVFSVPDYDGDGGNSNHKVKVLSPDATATDLDKAATKDQLRDLESSNGIVRSADLNGDGYPDVVTGAYTVLSKDGRYEDATDEKHTPQRYWNGPMPRDTIAYDYDGDGDVDLVVLTVEGELELLPNVFQRSCINMNDSPEHGLSFDRPSNMEPLRRLGGLLGDTVDPFMGDAEGDEKQGAASTGAPSSDRSDSSSCSAFFLRASTSPMRRRISAYSRDWAPRPVDVASVVCFFSP